jgi:hypothetical protein
MNKPPLRLVPPPAAPLISERQKTLLAKLADPEVWKRARAAREADEEARYQKILADVAAERAGQTKPE